MRTEFHSEWRSYLHFISGAKIIQLKVWSEKEKTRRKYHFRGRVFREIVSGWRSWKFSTFWRRGLEPSETTFSFWMFVTFCKMIGTGAFRTLQNCTQPRDSNRLVLKSPAQSEQNAKRFFRATPEGKIILQNQRNHLANRFELTWDHCFPVPRWKRWKLTTVTLCC